MNMAHLLMFSSQRHSINILLIKKRHNPQPVITRAIWVPLRRSIDPLVFKCPTTRELNHRSIVGRIKTTITIQAGIINLVPLVDHMQDDLDGVIWQIRNTEAVFKQGGHLVIGIDEKLIETESSKIKNFGVVCICVN